jgi:hypothetical protein
MQRMRPFRSDSSSSYNSNTRDEQASAPRKHDLQLFDAMLQLRECRLENERLAKQLAREQVETRAASEITASCSSQLRNIIDLCYCVVLCVYRACNGSMRTTQQRK